jgi:branched-subunit amino acid aminotransferase/4-amino-4-deoxychorismate lyase
MKGESMLAFHNGRFVPYSELHIAPHDAGFVFGATVTDFCRTYAHKLFRWPDHLARLRRDAAACFVPLPYSDAELTAAAEHLVSENAKPLPPGDDLALITFATPGPLGYMIGDTANGPPTVAMHTFPIPKERYRRFFTEGVTLIWAGAATNTRYKHRNRLHWWTANQWSARHGSSPHAAVAVPVLWGPSSTLDTAIGAVLSVQEGVVCRHKAGYALDSISLDVVEELCAASGLAFEEREQSFGQEELNESELLLAGSAFGVAGVSRFVWNDEVVPYPWPGPVFAKLAAAWSELVGVDIVKQFTG